MPEPGTHEHECDKCFTIWSHGDDMAGNEAAHRCPNCGHLQWWKRMSSSCRAFAQALYDLMRL